MVLISVTAVQSRPAWLSLQRLNEFKIQDKYSEKLRSNNIHSSLCVNWFYTLDQGEWNWYELGLSHLGLWPEQRSYPQCYVFSSSVESLVYYLYACMYDVCVVDFLFLDVHSLCRFWLWWSEGTHDEVMTMRKACKEDLQTCYTCLSFFIFLILY